MEPAFGVVVIGMSAGGVSALRSIARALPTPLRGAIVIAHHIGDTTILPDLIHAWTAGRHRARFARDGAVIENGCIYVCPGSHHVVVNPDATFGLSAKERIDHVRPSVDWLFASAAASFGDRCVAVVLSGTNRDGARGACRVARANGTVIIQDPADCAYPEMPRAAIGASVRHQVRSVPLIADAISTALEAIGRIAAAAWDDPFEFACASA